MKLPDWLATPNSSDRHQPDEKNQPTPTEETTPDWLTPTEENTPNWLTPTEETTPNQPTPTNNTLWYTNNTKPNWLTTMLTTPQPTNQQPTPQPTNNHTLITIIGAKGGIGKTTIALTLADTAVHYGPTNYRVSLIDANRGQADTGTYLNLPDTLPTILDTLQNNQPLQQHLTPKTTNPHRPGLGNIGFAITLAPPTDLSDPTLTTPQLYLDTINTITLNSNLTIIDTQTTENHDTTGIIQKAIIPATHQNAGWILALTDTTRTSPKNLHDRIQQLTRQGINPNHIIIAINKTQNNDPATQNALNTLQPLGIQTIQIPHNPLIKQLTDQARLPTPCPTLNPPIRQILTQTTGIPCFTQTTTPTPTHTTPQPTKTKTGLRAILNKILK